MARAEPLLLLRVDEAAPASLGDWAGHCAAALAAGEHLLSLFGRQATGPAGPAEQVITTAVLQGADGSLRLLRGCGRRGAAFASLTPRFAAAQLLERELWEQTGLQPAGHPWLKPVRYEGLRQQQMAGHPFFKVRGPEVHEVGVGPIHASVIEPGHFRFMCHGEQVHHLEIQLGYQHRGIEPLLLKRPPLALTPLVECIAGDTSIAHGWAYCAAVEALAGCAPDPAVDRVRGVALELERIAMHLVALTGLATDIAFLQGGASYGRLRTAIINATQRVCGSRFGRGWLRPGGLRFGLTPALRQDLLATLAAFAKDLAEVNDLMRGARSVRARYQGVGVVSQQAARDIGLTGLAARASGVALDSRASLPGWLYSAHPAALLTEAGGDCWARLTLRMREIDESLRWLRDLLAAPALDLDSAATAVPRALTGLAPDTLCLSLREGFRGPVLHALETDAAGRLLHYKVQDPSLQNWFGLALALRGNDISDFPVCNKSFDLSYCGSDL